MNEEQKAEKYSCIFQGYIEEAPREDIHGRAITGFDGYEFYIHLTSMREQIRGEEKPLELPKHFKIKVYCPSSYKEKEEDKHYQKDETLGRSLIPSIHVGSLIEFRGTAYKKSQNGDRCVVIPQEIKTAKEIRMDRHHIRIMPPNDESVTRCKNYVREVRKEEKERDRWYRNMRWRNKIGNAVEEVKKNKIAIIIGVAAIIAEIIAILITISRS